jgi:RNA polymerase sigma factor (sigma-70 family)
MEREAREADLDAWMSRLAGGDRSAFEPLYAALRVRAHRFARMRVGEEAAADVTQAALLKVFARASEFTPGKPCLPWFYAIVVNEIRATQRKDARLVPSEIRDDALATDPTAGAEGQMIERELGRALELAVASLDDDAAAAIAAVLGREPLPACAPATFRKRVSRAYAKLRLILGVNDAT